MAETLADQLRLSIRRQAAKAKLAQRAQAKADAKARRLRRGKFGNARQISLFGRLLGGTASGKSG